MYWSEKGSIGVYDAFLQRRKRLSMLYNSCKNMIFFNLRKHIRFSSLFAASLVADVFAGYIFFIQHGSMKIVA